MNPMKDGVVVQYEQRPSNAQVALLVASIAYSGMGRGAQALIFQDAEEYLQWLQEQDL